MTVEFPTSAVVQPPANHRWTSHECPACGGWLVVGLWLRPYVLHCPHDECGSAACGEGASGETELEALARLVAMWEGEGAG